MLALHSLITAGLKVPEEPGEGWLGRAAAGIAGARPRQEGRPRCRRQSEHRTVPIHGIANQYRSIKGRHLDAGTAIGCRALSPCQARFFEIGHSSPPPCVGNCADPSRRYLRVLSHAGKGDEPVASLESSLPTAQQATRYATPSAKPDDPPDTR